MIIDLFACSCASRDCPHRRPRPAEPPSSPEPNPTTWIGPILCCAVPDTTGSDGICGEAIESEPCPRHGTEVPPIEIQLPRRFVLAGSWGEFDDEIREHGWTVVNAPRPLIGRRTWFGDFVSGCLYAAGPLEELVKYWRADDAVRLVQLTPRQVIARLRVECVDHGYDFDEVLAEAPEQIGCWAEDLRMPWDQAWLADPALMSTEV